MSLNRLARQVLLAALMRNRSSGRSRTRERIQISDLAYSRLGVDPAELFFLIIINTTIDIKNDVKLISRNAAAKKKFLIYLPTDNFY